MAISHQVVPRLIFGDRLVLHISGNQVEKRLGSHIELPDRLPESKENWMDWSGFLAEHFLNLHAPFGEPSRAVILAFVPQIVGRATKRIDACEVRPQVRRNDPRSHGEIFVMLIGQHQAIGVGRSLWC